MGGETKILKKGATWVKGQVSDKEGAGIPLGTIYGNVTYLTPQNNTLEDLRF